MESVFDLLNYLLITIAATFVIINPVTTALVFVSLLPHANKTERLFVAKRATVVATGVLLVFATLGGSFFNFLILHLRLFELRVGSFYLVLHYE